MGAATQAKLPATFLGRDMYYGWWIVVACIITGALGGGFYHYGLSAFFLHWQAAFSTSRGTISLVLGIGGFINTGALGPFLGAFLDRHGSRGAMITGTALMGLGFVLMSTAHSLVLFSVYFLLFASLGMGMSAGHTANAAITQWFVRKRGLAFGLVNALSGVGAFLVVLTNLLIDTWGWREACLIIGLTVWIVGLPMAALFRHRPEKYGLLPDGDKDRAPLQASGTPVNRPDGDFTAREALRTQAFWLLYVAFTLRILVSVGVLYHFIPALVDKDVSSATAAALLGLYGVIGMPGRLLAGTLGDRMDKRLVNGVLIVILAVACLELIWAKSLWQLVVFVILVATGSGGTGTIQHIITAEYFGRKAFATIAGFGSVITVTGMLGGPVIAGYVYDATRSYDLTLVIFAGLSVLSLGFLALARRPASSGQPPVIARG